MKKFDGLSVARVALLSGLCLSALAAAAADDQQNAPAQSANGTDADTIIVTGERTDSAQRQAPSQTPLAAVQPTSIVSQHFIENNVVQTGNYDDAIKFTPSFANAEPNGPGLQESKFITIRGFQDGQYNLTYDGIPLAGSPTSFHHESAVYFMEHDLGGVQIDRGPGTASTVGNATFGGTLNLLSKAPSQTLTGDLYSTFGSFGTALEGAEFDTGAIQSLNGASFIGDVERLNSDGFLTDSGSRRTNGYAKGVVPIGEDTVISFVGMLNHTEQRVPSGTSLQEMAQNGYDFGLNRNPASNNDALYNYSTYGTDLEYVAIHSNLGDGWVLDNRVYTDFLSHDNDASTKNNDDLTADFTSLSTKYAVGGAMLTSAQVKSGQYNNQVLGDVGKQDYRAWGDILRLSKDVDFGQIRAGFWADRTDNSYDQYNVDFSDGGQAYVKCTSTALASCPASGAFSYLLHDWANTLQGYVEADIKPIDGLTLTPGIKYSFYRMSEDAGINSSTKLPAKSSDSWGKVLPSFNANYRLTDGWSVYAQAAEGFQAPPLNAFFTAKPNDVQPETTWNYQAGTVFRSDRLVLSGDVYYIDFGNYFTSYKDAAGDTIYTSAGSATYKGVELEGTFYVGGHVSLYGNATVNSATYANHQWIANAPVGTGSLGLLYEDQSGLSGSLLTKFVGRQEGLDNVSNATGAATLIDQYALPSYYYTDLAVSYAFQPEFTQSTKLSFKIGNLFDQRTLIGYAGTDAAGPALYWVLPGRSFFGTVEVKF